MKGLTQRQREVLAFVQSFTEEHHYPPTTRDVCKNFNFTSTNGAADHLNKLKLKGYLVWVPTLTRTLRVTEEGKDALELGVLMERKY